MSYLLLVPAILSAVWWFLSRKADEFIFHPVHTFLPGKIPGKIFFLPSAGGKIQTVYSPAKNGKDTILFFHGNGGNLSHFAPFMQRYAAHGLGVLMFDYRGFGQSTGKLSEQHAYEDGQTALEYLLCTKKIPPHKIILWGYSLGNAVCLQTALHHAHLPLKAVIAQSPFTDTADMAAFRLSGHYKPWDWKQKVTLIFLKILLWNKRLNNTQKISRVQAPLLVAYSKNDEIVPWQMSAALARLAPHGTQAYASESGSHGEFAWLEQRALSFLSDCGK